MPYTIKVRKSDNSEEAVGVFESIALADRHRAHDLQNKNAVVIPIKDPLLPENFISMDELRKAANFALTVLRDLKKAEKSGYVAKCVDDLQEALKDKPYEIKLVKFIVLDPRNNKRDIVDAVNEPAAAIAAGYSEDVVENWAHYLRIERVV